LGAQFLSARESLHLLTALRRSPLYRPDQHSYLLYPDRRLPRFTEKNNLPPKYVRQSVLLKKLLADGNRLLIEQDASGRCHFRPHLTNAEAVKRVLAGLATAGYARLVASESAGILELYETLFDHRAFTGRSGTFYGYEGLGCIYWHMVSKLLLSVQESFFRATGSPFAARLAECYHDLRLGIGDFKTPENYGAFPMDPYSHTPAQTGARQPGLTGQVKEDILCRFGELGVSVRAGRIHFEPRLLRPEEFLAAPDVFTFYNIAGQVRTIRLKAGSLAFTYCQVPVVYQLASASSLTLVLADGRSRPQAGLALDESASRAVFNRTGAIKSVLCNLGSLPITERGIVKSQGGADQPPN